MPSRPPAVKKSSGRGRKASQTRGNKELVKRWFSEVWNHRRADRIDRFRADTADASGLAAGSRNVRGPESFKAFHANILGAFPDFHVTVEDMIAEKDKVAVRISCKGTHKGATLGATPTGRTVEFSGILIARIKNNKIVETWNSIDLLSLLTQVDAIQDAIGPGRFLRQAK
jgi:steroid delta-isomerase-like uncharacterized protein